NEVRKNLRERTQLFGEWMLTNGKFTHDFVGLLCCSKALLSAEIVTFHHSFGDAEGRHIQKIQP
ncbi:MAG: hypothetical protein RR323_04440, partial [Raoultibacter sp.]